MRLFFACVFAGVLLTKPLFAQQATDLIAVDAKVSNRQLRLNIASIQTITDRPLYDNQPSFINDKQLAFSAADEQGNHDIIIYNVASGKFINLTQTRDFKEYSPSITDCGLYVSAVTVEPTGKQRLWMYPTNFGEPELLYDDLEPVGYYAWYNSRAAMFILGSPNKLVYPYSRDEVLTIAENVGRSIQLQPKTAVITYVDKNDMVETDLGRTFAIKGFDLEKRESVVFGRTVPGAEDFIWLSKEILLMGAGDALYTRVISENTWSLVGNIALEKHSGITRLAYSPKLKKLVLVMNRK
jgi:hypothetical protein